MKFSKLEVGQGSTLVSSYNEKIVNPELMKLLKHDTAETMLFVDYAITSAGFEINGNTSSRGMKQIFALSPMVFDYSAHAETGERFVTCSMDGQFFLKQPDEPGQPYNVGEGFYMSEGHVAIRWSPGSDLALLRLAEGTHTPEDIEMLRNPERAYFCAHKFQFVEPVSGKEALAKKDDPTSSVHKDIKGVEGEEALRIRPINREYHKEFKDVFFEMSQKTVKLFAQNLVNYATENPDYLRQVYWMEYPESRVDLLKEKSKQQLAYHAGLTGIDAPVEYEEFLDNLYDTYISEERKQMEGVVSNAVRLLAMVAGNEKDAIKDGEYISLLMDAYHIREVSLEEHPDYVPFIDRGIEQMVADMSPRGQEFYHETFKAHIQGVVESNISKIKEMRKAQQEMPADLAEFFDKLQEKGDVEQAEMTQRQVSELMNSPRMKGRLEQLFDELGIDPDAANIEFEGRFIQAKPKDE